MKKFQAVIKFTMDEDFMSFVPPHRTYINYLMNKSVIDSYAVSMESSDLLDHHELRNQGRSQSILTKIALV